MIKNKRDSNLQPARNYKARSFEMIFRDKGELLSLYNAANQTSYTNPDELESIHWRMLFIFP